MRSLHLVLMIGSVMLTAFATAGRVAADTGKALSYTMTSIDGKEVDLSNYQGKVVLIVNVASQCGLTPQYKQLQALHEEMAGQGLAVLGFPCNQFGKQEPGTASEIKQFCQQNYGVTFDMFSKIEVNGDEACELYKYLTSVESKPQGNGSISWNFEKFLLDRDGNVIGRFSPRTRPDEGEFLAAIHKAIHKALNK